MENATLKKIAIAIAILLVANLALGVYCITVIDRQAAKIDGFSADLDRVSDTVQEGWESISSQIQESLDSRDNIVSEFSYAVVGKPENGKVDVVLCAKPKSYQTGAKMYFSYNAGADYAIKAEATSTDGISFLCTLSLPVNTSIQLDFSIENKDGIQSQPLDPISDVMRSLTQDLYLTADISESAADPDEETPSRTVAGSISLLDKRALFGNKNQIVSAEIRVTVGGKEVARIPMKNSADEFGVISDNYFMATFTNYVIECGLEDTVQLIFEGKDAAGLIYTQLVEDFPSLATTETQTPDKDSPGPTPVPAFEYNMVVS